MNAQFIEKDGHREWAILPYATYQSLLEAYEMLHDIQAFDAAIARREEQIPAAYVDRLLSGESPIRVWREYRRMSQDALALACGVAGNIILAVEEQNIPLEVELCSKIARSLNVDIDELR